MKQKRIIFSLISVLYFSIHGMEKSTVNENPAGYIKCGNALLPVRYLNDVVLLNILPSAHGKVTVNFNKWQETKDRPSILPGFQETRDKAEWTNSINGKSARYINPSNVESFLKELNDQVLVSSKK